MILIKILMLLVYIFQMVYRQGVLIHLKIEAIQELQRETQYGVTKVQTNEYMSPGTLEEISIAVTLEKDALPVELTLEELKELVAHAASPKADPENVTIAFADSA